MNRSVRPATTGSKSLLILFAAAFLGWGCDADRAHAQLPGSAKEQEEALIRQELERIITEDTTEAANARNALDALNQPEASVQGRQARNRRERGTRRIVNGLPALGHPAVGALLKGNDPRSAQAWCTGTLVGCDKFLTAAHCIAKDPSEESYLVFFQELGFFAIKRIDWPKAEYKFPYFDLAMLTLALPVEGIAPISINLTTKPLNKSVGTIVGFGRTGGNRYDYGIKREGSVLTETCPSAYQASKVLCWKFDADVKSLSSPSNTCNADSGGGVFLPDTEGGRTVQKVFGVVSGGNDDNCIKADLSYNVDVHEFRSWIESTGEGRLSSRMCGAPLWQGRAQEPKRFVLDISEANSERATRIDVPANATALRIAMNSEDNGNGQNDFDLLVYRGEPSPEAMSVCSKTGPGQFAFCEIRRPTAGAWTFVVKRKKGAGKAQITTTVVY